MQTNANRDSFRNAALRQCVCCATINPVRIDYTGKKTAAEDFMQESSAAVLYLKNSMPLSLQGAKESIL